MKKTIPIIVVALLIVTPLIVASLAATAEGYIVPLPAAYAEEAAGQTATEPSPEPVVPGEPLTWPYLGTIAGAAALALLIVQYTKAPLDHVWKIPTRLFVYIVCLVIMLVATALTDGLTADNALLVVVNALLAAITAYGAYEVSYAKIEAKKQARPTVEIN